MERDLPTILVTEDQKINREILCHILEPEYRVIEAENGAQALEILKKTPQIDAILLDIVMPVMDGYAVLQNLKASAFADIPVIVMTGEKDDGAEQKALDLGAWDFVSKPYRPRTLLSRLKNVIVRSRYYLMDQMKHAYEHDQLTDLYNRATFFIETRKLLDENPDKTFALVRFDINHFQIYNSFFSDEEGDRLLLFLADRLRQIAQRCEPCTYGRMTADVFCLCMPFNKTAIEKYAAKAWSELAAYNESYHIEPTFGIYVIENRAEKIQVFYDCATLAAKSAKSQYMTYLGYYRPEMSETAVAEQQLINEVQNALETQQFEVYLQPKYNLSTEQPYGAEALIRWRHPRRGMLSPGVFIPAFERNGVIGKIDYYMWDKVCALLQKWQQEGRRTGPVSVNVSRVNMYNPNLLSLLLRLTRKYQIPPSLLPLELTESAYMQNPEIMSKTVRALQSAGFTIMMDDFGSGYSSLNSLKDIPVDVLKIDMKFLSGQSDTARGNCILATVIRMASWMDTPVVMEGVETRQQVDFLKALGCCYVQGYYFAKPMPVSDYEALLDNSSPAPMHLDSENLQVLNQTIWSANPQTDLLFNSMQQPAAICEVEGDQFRILRENPSFSRFFGYGPRIDSRISSTWQERLLPETRQVILQTLQCAAETRRPQQCCYACRSREGKMLRVRMEARYWGKNGPAQVLLSQFSAAAADGTEETNQIRCRDGAKDEHGNDR